MDEFHVEWSIGIHAEDAVDAVRQVWGIVQDPESTATYFRVINSRTGENIFRDFAEELAEDPEYLDE